MRRPTTTARPLLATISWRARHSTPPASSPPCKTTSYRPVVTRNTTLLDPGLAAYVNKVGFPVENAFMFLFMWLLILTAFFLACFLLTSLVLLIIPSRTRSPLQKLVRLSPVSLAIGLRALLFVYPPLSLFTFWQWRLGSSDARAPSSSASSSGSVPRSPSASSAGVSSAITLVDTLELVRRPRRHVQAW
ncbi:hypothetical protein PGTUg99_011742 [Puccinia graminis f. sp. tritici]|uniref:TRP C-terminal domain-containing protein n=1 Tax=Puccinia graminis f. sp. tritici TaxID=56615 RepID=A0A5B0NT85_PUCGR|nr:hypothetical protein PGTUg99_011742 [Puccinia graminis f. sp. tritici]